MIRVDKGARRLASWRAAGSCSLAMVTSVIAVLTLFALPAEGAAQDVGPDAVEADEGEGAEAVRAYRAPNACIDESIRRELDARRRYRGVEARLFRKRFRHELSVAGGLYASDLLSSFPLVFGAYTFHFAEAVGLELGFGYTRQRSELIRAIEADRGIAVLQLDEPVFLYQGHLLFSLAYGKLRWVGTTISRFDFYLALGGGFTDNETTRGATFSGGFGFKMYFGEWFGLRFDVRDQVLQQELLGEATIANNLVATFGLSIFLPPRAYAARGEELEP